MSPKKPDSRAKALAGMTKAELVKTVKQLDARQTKLLNQIAELQANQPVPAAPANAPMDLSPREISEALPNAFDGIKDQSGNGNHMLRTDAFKVGTDEPSEPPATQHWHEATKPQPVDLTVDSHGRTVFPWEKE